MSLITKPPSELTPEEVEMRLLILSIYSRFEGDVEFLELIRKDYPTEEERKKIQETWERVEKMG